jgi:hypothetical protein
MMGGRLRLVTSRAQEANGNLPKHMKLPVISVPNSTKRRKQTAGNSEP